MLVDDVLKEIPDDASLTDLIKNDTPTDQLVQSYQEVAKDNDDIPNVEPTKQTGIDLKQMVEALTPDQQTALLTQLGLIQAGAAVKNDEKRQSYETRKDREDRRFRYGLINKVFYLMAVVVVTVVISIAYVTIKTGAMPDLTSFGGIFNTASEVIKLLFSTILPTQRGLL